MNKIAIMSDRNVVHGSFGRGIVRRIMDSIKGRTERREAIRQLSGMSDRMLRDIGVQRHEIHMTVNRPRVPAEMVFEKTGRPEASGELRKVA